MFKIYYENRKVVLSYHGRESEPGAYVPVMDDHDTPLPHTGVVAIVQDDIDAGWTIITGYEYYIFLDTKWIGTDFWGVLDFLEAAQAIEITSKGAKKKKGGPVDMVQLRVVAKNYGVLSGQMVTKSKQEEIFAEIAQDPDLNRTGDWTYPERAITVRTPRGRTHETTGLL